MEETFVPDGGQKKEEHQQGQGGLKKMEDVYKIGGDSLEEKERAR